jgi:hypothetical protein
MPDFECRFLDKNGDPLGPVTGPLIDPAFHEGVYQTKADNLNQAKLLLEKKLGESTIPWVEDIGKQIWKEVEPDASDPVTASKDDVPAAG